MPKQHGINDCGLFALAYAKAICESKEPDKLLLNGKTKSTTTTAVNKKQTTSSKPPPLIATQNHKHHQMHHG